jgi:hypothetical protein
MMESMIFWLYLANATLLIVHEMDSAYWKEWDLFGLPGGPGGFMLLHLPLVGVMLYGLAEVLRMSLAGLALSLVLAAGGVFAFVIHNYFIRKGRPEFRTGVSLFILYAAFLVSLVQAVAAAYLLALR